MKRCGLCGKERDDSEFVAAHCVRCDELMMDALECEGGERQHVIMVPIIA